MQTTADYDGPYISLEDALSEFDSELERRLAEADLEHRASDDECQETGRPWSKVRPEFVALINRTFPPSE